jgi:hypothetical protein
MVCRSPKSEFVVTGLVWIVVVVSLAVPASGQSRQAQPAGEPAGPSEQPVIQPAPEAAYDSEFCEVLDRWNADKKISDAKTRDRFAGEYGRADDIDRRQTWSVETACGEFLVAVPLWADVSPPVLARRGDNIFEDSMQATWKFQIGGDGTVTGVVMTSADGVVSTMTRLGASRHWGDPHENLNGKHIKDWEGKKK